MTVFSFMAIIGWLGALTFLLLFLFHRSTRNTRKQRSHRVFWLFIVADSIVMLMIYTMGLLNIFLHEWPFKDTFRFVLGTSALLVVWWRVSLFVRLNVLRRKPMEVPSE